MIIKRITALLLAILLLFFSFPSNLLAKDLNEVKKEETIATTKENSSLKAKTEFYKRRIASNGRDAYAYVNSRDELYCWGENIGGVIGNGTTSDVSIPTLILRDVKEVDMNISRAIALKNDGSVWTWGAGNYWSKEFGGDGDQVPALAVYSKPRQISNLSEVEHIYSSGGCSYAILKNGNISTIKYESASDGISDYLLLKNSYSENTRFMLKNNSVLSADGSNACGEHGDQPYSGTYGYTPDVISGVKDFDVGATAYGLCGAIKNNGDLYIWGALDSSVRHDYEPVKILSNISQMSMGFRGGVAVSSDGILYDIYRGSTGASGSNEVEKNVVAAKSSQFGYLFVDSEGNLFSRASGTNSKRELICNLGRFDPNKVPEIPETPETPDQPSTPEDSVDLDDLKQYADLENEFKRNYVNSHVKYINGKYKKEITRGFSGALGEAAEIIRNDKFNNTYNFNKFISQMLTASYKEDEAPYLAILTSFLDTDISEDYYNDVFYNKSLDKYFDNAGEIISSLEKAGKINGVAEKLKSISELNPNSNEFKTSINEIDSIIDQNVSKADMKKYLKISGALDVLDNITNIVGNSASDTLHYIDYYLAYQESSDKLMESLKEMRSAVSKSTTYPGKNQLEGTQYANGMAKALDRMINEIESAKNGSNGSDLAKEFAKSIASQGTQAAASKFGSTIIGSIPCVSTVRNALGGINHISDYFYNGKSRNYNADLVKKLDLTACVIRAAADKKASDLKAGGKLDSRFNKAVEFDYLIKLYKSTLIQGYNSTRDFIKNSIIPNKKIGKVTDETLEAIKEGKLIGACQSLIIGIEEQINEINDIRCHELSFDRSSSKKVSYYSSTQSKKLRNYLIDCPVKIIVKDDSGKVFATLTDSGVNCPEGYERFFFVYQEEDGSYGKSIIVPSDYTVELEGTGNGNMTALINHYDEDQNTSTYFFNNIPITNSTKGTFEKSVSNSEVLNLKLDESEYKPDLYDNSDGSEATNPNQPSNPSDSPSTTDQPSNPSNPDMPSEQVKIVPIYRLYNSGNNEHLFTSDLNEYNTLAGIGWTQEGVGWNSPNSGDPVYRLYSPVTCNHLFTTDLNEKNVLSSQGWLVDNGDQPLFYSGGSLPIYRLYHEGIRQHLLTKDNNEYNVLGANGWNQEGIKLYGLSDEEATIPRNPSQSDIPVTGVSVNPTYMKLEISQSQKITATVLPANATNKNIKWTSSDSSVATIDNGMVTAKKAGSSIISVKTVDGSFRASCTVTVVDPVSDKPSEDYKLIFEANEINVKVGETKSVNFDIEPSPGDFDLIGFDGFPGGVEINHSNHMDKFIEITGISPGTYTVSVAVKVNNYEKYIDSAFKVNVLSD